MPASSAGEPGRRPPKSKARRRPAPGRKARHMPSKKYQLARYRNEALRPDFELEVEDGKSIVIRQPDVDEVLDLNGMTDPRAILQVLAKDQYEELMQTIGSEPGGMLQALIDDIVRHFGLGK